MNYFLSAHGQVTGPFNCEELIDSLKYGGVPEDATICPEGSDDWRPISSVIESEEPQPAQQPVLAQPADIQEEPQTPFADIRDVNPDTAAVFNEHYQGKSTSTAVLLEVIIGTLLQTFGIGHIYAGRIVTGIILMLSYWALLAVNIVLVFFIIGIVTLPLTYIIYLGISVISVQKVVDRVNWQVIMEGERKV